MDIECAHCGNKELVQIPGAWTPFALGDEGLMQGPVVPLVLLACNSCGFVQLFSTNRLQPTPWPETPQEPPQEPEAKG